MPEPLISVCVPVYNGAHYIEETLECVLSQTYSNLEILISDDCSTDHSIEVIKKVKNKNVSFYNQNTRLGWVGNCNFLISKSRGAYFSILPQDDLIPYNYFEKISKGFKKNNLTVNCYPYIQIMGIQGGMINQSSIIGTLENRIYDVILNHFWAVSFRGIVKNNIPDSLRYLSSNQHRDMMADTLWILQHALAGELHSMDVPYQKRYHATGEHMTWINKPIKDKISAWSQHCASMYHFALPFVSDHEQLYTSCLTRLLQKKQYLVEIKTNDHDHLLLKEFKAKIKYVERKQ